MATPDFDFLIGLYQESEIKINKEYIKWSTEKFIPDVSNTFSENEYQASFVVNNFFRDWYHKVIYNFDSLKLMLEKSGFLGVERKKVDRSEIPALQGLEKHGDIIPEIFNELETVVVEAKK